MDCSPPGSSGHEISQAKSTGVGCHFLLYGIFLAQGWNLSILHWQADALPRSLILEWVAISFSKGSSRPRDQTQVSHIAGRRFTLWATREAHHGASAAAVAKSLQSCPTLCPIDGSPPGFPVPWIFQARTLEWVAISSPMHESEKWRWSCSVVSNSSWSHGLQPTRFLHSWDFLGKSTGVGCHCLLCHGASGEGK